jgi:hypothetical protein
VTSKADRPDQPNASSRFNEEKATYTVRGADAPDLEAGIAAIRAVVKTLPVRSGVYRMLDARGDVLYVGKARALKNRVTNYTQVPRLTKRLQRMVAQTRSMQIVTTHNEAEALLLEAQLIKRFRPPYNVLLRDDKSFPFILLREDHPFARVQKHRGARRVKQGHYYGPFASAGSVTRTLNALQTLFLLRSCSDSFFANRSRPCLLYQIRRCSAPCVGRIDEAAYAELVADAKAFLAGKSTGVQARLGKQMAEAAQAQDYELAAVYRDRLRALTYIQGSQTVHAEGLGDGDIFALAGKGGAMCISTIFLSEMNLTAERGELFGQYERIGTLSPAEQADLARRWRALDQREQMWAADFEKFMAMLLRAIEVAGVDHVCVGADWDGGGGLNGIQDIAALPKVTARLKAAAALAQHGTKRRAREAMAARLASVQSLLRDLIALGVPGGVPLANGDLTHSLEQIAPAFSVDRLSDAFAAVGSAEAALDRYASPKLVADWLAVSI